MDNIDLELLRRLLQVPECKDRTYKKYPIPTELEEQIIKEQNGKCYLHNGGTTQPCIHHIVPDSPSTRDNLVMICNSCHYWVHLMLASYKGYRKAMRVYGSSPYY